MSFAFVNVGNNGLIGSWSSSRSERKLQLTACNCKCLIRGFLKSSEFQFFSKQRAAKKQLWCKPCFLIRGQSEQQDSEGDTENADSIRMRDHLKNGPLKVTTGALPERVVVVVFCFLSFVICNMDRVNVSVAILPMAGQFGWSQSTVGLIQSAFFWGYLVTQIPGGYLADKYGGKHVLGLGVLSWSLMTFITPFAAAYPLPVLLLSRALLGFGEGVAMPAMNQMVSKWVPSGERSRSLSLIYSGMYFGSVIGLLACPKLISTFGWHSVFTSFGLLGIIWWLFWNALVSSNPGKSNRISKEEKMYIMNQTNNLGTKKRTTGNIPWSLLFSKKATWAIIVAHFCTTWGYFVLLTWLPTYFNQHLGLNLASSSIFSILPWLSMAVSANFGGWCADYLLSRGFSVTFVRKLLQTIGLMGPALFLSIVCFVSHPATAVLCMALALGLGSFAQSGVYANHQDIGPDYAGILLGISNSFAAIPGIVGVALTGYILDRTGGAWSLVFALAIGFYIIGTLVYNLLGTGERVF
eukprot:jgi/Galph1/5859/GphlegSOOS_G4501.1